MVSNSSTPTAPLDRALSSFNARTYSAQRVARSFVPSEAFYELTKPSHTMLSGPRGSGKTTLMKMLQPEALEHWTHLSAPATLRSVEYTGVFVATDRVWKQQLEPQTALLLQQSIALETIANSAFATQIARELVSTMAWRCHSTPFRELHHPRVSLSLANEQLLVRELTALLRLKVEVPRLESVVSALVSRYREHGELLRRADVQVDSLPGWIIRDALGTAEACVRLFNNATGQPDHQWALIFDEMELAPVQITESVLDAMRGTQSIILYKLSLAPVQPELARLNLPNAGVHGQDFELIMLTVRPKADLEFARELITNELKTRYGPETPASLEELFGPGRFVSDLLDDGVQAAGTERYAIDAPLWRRFQSLADTDSTFASWLVKHDVDLYNLGALRPNERAAKLRKIRNVVLLREFYRRPNQTGRKSNDLYTGIDGLLSLGDGNPRLLMALLGRLLPPEYPRNVPIQRSDQSAAIDSVIDRFLSLLRAQPAADMPDGRSLQAFDLIQQIGETLGRSIIGGHFNDNIVTSFKVDGGLPSHLVRTLQIALNIGAIMHIPEDTYRPVPIDLAGQTFRLSYLLAPRYRLPLRLGEARSLRRILLSSPGRRWLFTERQQSRPRPELSASRRRAEALFEIEDGSD